MLGMTERQLRHCRHTFVAFAFTAVAEMMMPCTFTRRDTCSDCRGRGKTKYNQMVHDDSEDTRHEMYVGTLRLRMDA